LVGRVVNGLGRVIDEGPVITREAHYPLYAAAPSALSRPRIREPLSTGIRALDAMLTAGRGKRCRPVLGHRCGQEACCWA